MLDWRCWIFFAACWTVAAAALGCVAPASEQVLEVLPHGAR